MPEKTLNLKTKVEIGTVLNFIDKTLTDADNLLEGEPENFTLEAEIESMNYLRNEIYKIGLKEQEAKKLF